MNERGPLMAIAVFVVTVLFGYGWYAATEGVAPFGPSDAYTGVFLTNGQAYFGHYYEAPGEYVQLRDVHYLLSNTTQDARQAGQSAAGQTPQISLNRLGGEIHGPKPDMKISKAQILFIEELRPDSGLVAAIVALRNQPPQPPVTTPPAASPSPSAAPATPSPSASRPPSPSASPAR